VTAGLKAYWAAINNHNESAFNQPVTAGTREESSWRTLEERKSEVYGLGWSDYPQIEIVEVTLMKCDEILCKAWYDGISTPAVEDPERGRDFPFEFESSRFFRLVDGTWLADYTRETTDKEWQSTHRP
jgi:hypothetical protein